MKSKGKFYIRFYTILFSSLIAFSGWVEKGKREVDTRSVAELTLRKGLDNIDLGLYPGILLMHGMSELAAIHPEKDWLDKAIDLFKKYSTKEIKGRGSYICYETGGSGAAYLYHLNKAELLGQQVKDGAVRMVANQKRSTEGLLIPPSRTENQVFIDMAFAVTPYLLYSGLAFDNQDYIDLAVFETMELFRILADDETGLVHQGRGFQGVDVISQDNWSRGNGWGAFALAILIRDLPENHPQRPNVVQLAKSFFSAVIEHQDSNGLWHQEMTDNSSYIETSGSGLLLYGLGIMIEKKLLPSKYRKNLMNGLKGYMAYVADDGSISHTCKGCLCPKNGTKEDYKNHEWILNDHHAFGPAVLAFTQAYKMGIRKVRL